MKELVNKNMKEAQQQQKRWYDRNARYRSFEVNDMVLLLLPTSTSKLMAQWQGPYKVLRKLGRTNYLIEIPHARRSKRVFHVNLLKKWEPPIMNDLFADEADGEEFPDWKKGIQAKPVIGNHLSERETKELVGTLEEFSDVLQSNPKKTNLAENKISTKSKPIKLPPYRIPHAYRDEVLKELEDMERNGVIEPSQSEWAAPIVIVKKKDGSLRICVDYRQLNSVTSIDAYPMPRIDELIDKLGKAKFITTLDLARGYWQVPMSEDDRAKTAFTTPRGLYQFKVMPFGLCGAPATFQRMMDSVIRGLESHVAVYLDDVVVFSETWENHLSHIRGVLQRLRKYNLTAKPKKCQFGMHECIYLGHIVGNGQVKPDPNKLAAVKDYPIPKTKKEVRCYLGLTGYYRKFIANFAKLAMPLSDLTKKSLPDKVNWSTECEVAFNSLKKALCESPVLQSPDFNKQFVLQTDASDRGVGAVLSQRDENGCDRPTAFYSKKLLP